MKIPVLSAAIVAAVVVSTVLGDTVPEQDEARSDLQYGTNPSALSKSTTGVVSQYTYELYTSGQIHQATLANLNTNTKYFYRVGDASTNTWSPVYSFTSHPGVGKDLTHVFGVIGDLGQTQYSNDTVHHIMANPTIQSVFISGDLSYADNYQPRWDTWQRMMTPLTSSMPVHVAAGNHEIENLFGKEFVAYNARFQMPYLATYFDTSKNLFYSYNVGPAHVLVMCSYCNYSVGSAHYDFVEADLKTVDPGMTPWTIVIVHAPWYNSNKVHRTEGVPMREVYEDMFRGRVDFVFAGHVHAYERCYNTYNSTVDESGPIYITIGDGGNREGLYNDWVTPQPSWSAFHAAEYGHGTLQVNATTAIWKWHRDDDLEPVVSDSVIAHKQQ